MLKERAIPPMKDEHCDRQQNAQAQHAFDRCYGLTICKKYAL